jgi:two-component system NtrC family sensor kinase
VNIRSNIFLWVFAATVVPLTLLVLAVTQYSERQHLEQVDGQMMTGLNYMISEIDRRLTFERDVVEALAVSPSMQAFENALVDVDEVHLDEYEIAKDDLTTFLEEFQSVFLDVGTIRVLDDDANTVIKVRFGSRLDETVTGIKPYAYSESEAVDDFFFGEIQSLLPGQVSYVLLPESRNEFGFERTAPMLDAIVPLQDVFGQTSGYLLVNSIGVQIDRILELAPRLYSGKLMIAEINPDLRERDGLVLYDEALGLVFSTAKDLKKNLSDVAEGSLLEEVLRQPSGAFNTENGKYRIYYSEYLPYPNQLISWVIASAVPQDEISAPFARIRVAIILFAVFALIMSLLLANYGARRLADPIIELAGNLKAYARGEPLSQKRSTATSEIEELQSAFDYMAQTTREAEKERDQAELMLLQSAKLASIGEMAAGIGHEINNPLNNITALVRLIRRELPEDQVDVHNDLVSLQEETERATRIVRGILDFARQVPPKYTTIHVPVWVDESIALVQQMATDEGVSINTHVEPGLYVEGDTTQLQQVLINLIINAIHASPRGSSIEIEAHRTRDEAMELSVCDQGCGVSDEVMPKLFDPFFTTKPVGKGSGLGLSISLGIIQHHGGTISVHNNDFGGVSVVIRLPITAQHKPHD